MRTTKTWGLVLAAAAAASLAGCGGNGSNSQSTGGHGGSTTPGNGGTSNGGKGGTGASTGGEEDIGGGFGNGGNQGNGGAGGMACAGDVQEGQIIPLDMYLMLDKSGSMGDPTGQNGMVVTKWDAVTSALDAFFTDPGSDGLGVGLQFFPVLASGVPADCSSNADCGGAAPCVLKTCDNSGSILPCNSNGECGSGGKCVDLGHCTNDPDTLCLPVGGDCNPGPQNDPCVKVTSSFCLNQDSCAAGEYAAPAVEISTLNAAASALNAAIAATSPGGSTPTSAALQGAIDHASAWQAANPTHKVVALLATDGLPTECDPQDISSIAQIAADGKTAGVLTFVIGVFSINDAAAQQNLDTIAEAGGTSSAFFISGNQDVAASFLAALKAIQGQTLSCEYQIPKPPAGNELDFGKVNVQYTPPGAAMPETLLYVTKPENCDPMSGGWYYDVDPASGQAPTKILMCPASCTQLKGSGGKIAIEVGCQTIVPEPK